jgi:nitroreductase
MSTTANAKETVSNTLPFYDAVRARHATRGFLPKVVPENIIREILEDAQLAPSNCNTQPWNVHIVTGATRDEMSKALHCAFDAYQFSPDFTFDESEYFGVYKDREKLNGKSYMESMGVKRDDTAARHAAAGRNLSFFNAPQAAFLFLPSFGDNVRVAGDIGMYGQTFLLALAARGLAGIPQTMLGFFANTVREVLGVSQEWKLLFGISFGYEDKQFPANSYRMGRTLISECVTFHR